MEIKFDIVRIGNIRKNITAEVMLKQNIQWLKSSIKSSLSNIDNYEIDKAHFVLVIPAKGFNIKISSYDIKDKFIKKVLKENISNSFYKGQYSTILDNINNPIF
jgi:hypothetical protein